MGRLCSFRSLALAAALLVPLCVLAAGCGGSSHYSLESTRACLQKAHVRVRSRVDFLASTAPAGAFNVKFPDNQVTISFLEDSKQAAALAQAYRRVRGRNIGIEDVLRPQANAVLLWALHPDVGEEKTVKDCLK
jgi:hypothetical protein